MTKRILFDRLLVKTLINQKSILAILTFSLMSCFYNKTISHISGSVSQSSLEVYVDNMFGGYNYLVFDVFSLVSYLIIVGLPIFFICKYLGSLEEFQSAPYVIRFETKKVFLSKFINTCLFYISLYYLIYLAISIASIFIFTFDVTNLEINTLKVLTCSILLRFLEIIFLFYLVLFVYSLVKKPIVPFLVVVIAYSISALSLELFKLNPFGISSIARWAEYDNGFIISFLLLLVLTGFMHIILKKFLSNKFV